MVFTTFAQIFFRTITRITSTMGILTLHIIAIYAYHFFLLTNRVLYTFRTYSVYTLLFVLFLDGHHHNHFSEQQISIEDSHNGNYGHNFCNCSFNFFEIFFIKNTNANCNIITYRPIIFFIF